jgi:ESS family glutamate:Na+ symporter
MQFAFFIACGLLLVGFALLSRLQFLQRLFVPASVIGGAIGFAAIQLAPHIVPRYASTVAAVGEEYRSWPAWLIAAVFAAMLLERPATPFRESLRRTASEGIIVWIIVVGQLAIGLAMTWLLLGPVFGVPMAFGQLLEVGWAGGFGSASAWGVVFEKSVPGFNDARDMGVLFAATGLLYGVVSGLVLTNLAIRRRWVKGGTGGTPVMDERQTGMSAPPQTGMSVPPPAVLQQPIAFARVRREMIDPLAFQGLIVAAAFVVGIGLQAAVGGAAHWLGETLHHADKLDHVRDLPLFLFTLIGGLLVREAMYLLRCGHLIDPPSLHRITGVALEFLVVAAIASMRLSSITAFAVPSLLLMAVGAIWCVFTLVWLSPRLLARRYWFELGVINYEMATATTAQGMMVLRIVDPELESGAAEDYAMAAPLSAPFIGGGLITLAVPFLLLKVHVGWIVAAASAVTILLYLVGRRLRSS